MSTELKSLLQASVDMTEPNPHGEPPQMGLEFHPLADTFPLIEDEQEMEALIASIKDEGLLEPIVLYEGKILDGRNRYRACERLGIKPQTVEYEDDSPETFVLSMNVHRRHLSVSQRAMIGGAIATKERGRQHRDVDQSVHEADQKTKGSVGKTVKGQKYPFKPPTVDEVASALGIARASVVAARAVLDKGTPGEIAAVRQGSHAVNTMAKKIYQRRRGDAKGGYGVDDAPNKKQIASKFWQQFRTALINISDLPRADDMVKLVRSHPKRPETIDSRFDTALQWMKDFNDAWNATRT